MQSNEFPFHLQCQCLVTNMTFNNQSSHIVISYIILNILWKQHWFDEFSTNRLVSRGIFSFLKWTCCSTGELVICEVMEQLICASQKSKRFCFSLPVLADFLSARYFQNGSEHSWYTPLHYPPYHVELLQSHQCCNILLRRICGTPVA